MKKVFICSPYAGDIERNIEIARNMCREAIDEGYAPFAPHLHYPGIVDDTDEYERAVGIACGLSFMTACDEVWAYIGSGYSRGMTQELTHAASIGKHIKYFHKI